MTNLFQYASKKHHGVGLVLVFALMVATAPCWGQGIPDTEYASRRAALLRALQDGLVVLHAKSGPKEMEQPGWVQDASFLYFSGLVNQPGAILVLDGPTRQSHVFVSPPPQSFGFPVADLVLEPGEESARRIGVRSVQSWDALVPFLEQRIAGGVSRFYVDEARRPELPGVPEGLWPIAGEKDLWRRSLVHRFPDVDIASARSVIQALRWKKSAAEVEILDRNASMTGHALLAGLSRIRPGASQRDTEAAVVAGCIAAGAEGPSFWPWTMAGANGGVRRLVRAFFDYRQLNKTMEAGELVRMDVGCAAESYGGDVGRTAPVSGRFSPGQREAWDLLIAAYRVGMESMKAGVTIADVMRASRAEIERRRSSMTTPQGRAAAEFLSSERGMSVWSIHGVGIDSGETPLDTLVDGAVIAFEPMFEIQGDAFYLEDMIVVTSQGYRVLSDGLPYTAAEIEAAMNERGRQLPLDPGHAERQR